jgi:hypothetical protein
MKTILFLCSAIFLAPTAFAGPCVALDYQEMKDMSVNDLVKEACKTNLTATENFSLSLKYPSTSAAAREASRDNEQCSGQVDRMMRILETKGVTEKFYKLCEQQAQGKVIVATDSPTTTESTSQVTK